MMKIPVPPELKAQLDKSVSIQEGIHAAVLRTNKLLEDILKELRLM